MDDRNIVKFNLNEGKLTISWSFDVQYAGRWSQEVRSYETKRTPHPDLTKAIAALRRHAMHACELKTISGLEVHGAAFTYGDGENQEDDTVKMFCKKTLGNGQVWSFNTPPVNLFQNEKLDKCTAEIRRELLQLIDKSKFAKEPQLNIFENDN